jgi:hypothetical protein
LKIKNMMLVCLLFIIIGTFGEKVSASLSEVEMTPESISQTEETDSGSGGSDLEGEDPSGNPNIGIDGSGNTDPQSDPMGMEDSSFWDWLISQIGLGDSDTGVNDNKSGENSNQNQKGLLLELLKKGKITPELLMLLLGAAGAGALLAALLLGLAGAGGAIGLSLVAGFLIADSLGLSEGGSLQLLQLLLASSALGGVGGFLAKRFSLFSRLSALFRQSGGIQRLLSLLFTNKYTARLFGKSNLRGIPYLQNLKYAFSYALRKGGKVFSLLWNALKTPFIYLADYYQKVKSLFGSKTNKSMDRSVDTVEDVYKFTNDKELAGLADISYVDGIDNLNEEISKYGLSDKWVALEEHHTDSGLDIVIFQELDKGKPTSNIVFATRGTEFGATSKIKIESPFKGLPINVLSKETYSKIIPDWAGTTLGDIISNDGVKDLYTDGKDVVLGLTSQQVNDGEMVVRNFIDNPKNKDFNPVFVGHSLGGFISVHLSGTFEKPAFTFNAPGMFPWSANELKGYNEMKHFYVSEDEVGTYDLNSSFEFNWLAPNSLIDKGLTDYVRNQMPGEQVEMPYFSDERGITGAHGIDNMFFHEDGSAYTIEELKEAQGEYIKGERKTPITRSNYYKDLEERNLRARDVNKDKFFKEVIDQENISTVEN